MGRRIQPDRHDAVLVGTGTGVAVGSQAGASWLTAGRRLGAVRPQSVKFNGALAGGALVGAAGAKALGADDDAVSGALLGAAVGQGAHQLPGYAHSWFVRGRASDPAQAYMNQAIKRKDLPTPEQKKLRDKWEREERKPWLKDHPDPTDRYRNYPKHWPNARAERFKAHWAGGTKGKIINTALVVGGAAAGYGAVAHHKRGNVGKADGYEYHERRISAARAAGAGVGFGGIAYGVPRLRVLGRTLEHGRNLAALARNDKAVRRLVAAEDVRRRTESATAPLERAVRATPWAGAQAQRIPKGARGAVATVAGVEVARRSIPIHRDTYTPVVTASPVTGW